MFITMNTRLTTNRKDAKEIKKSSPDLGTRIWRRGNVRPGEAKKKALPRKKFIEKSFTRTMLKLQTIYLYLNYRFRMNVCQMNLLQIYNIFITKLS